MGKLLKWLSISVALLLVFTIVGVMMAENAPTPTQSEAVSENQLEIDIMQVVNKTPQEVEKILGKPSSFKPLESDKNPGTFRLLDGRRIKADNGFYKKGNLSFRIVFLEGKAGRLEVTYPKDKYSFNDYGKVLELINLPTNKEPSFTNDAYMRWEQSLNNLHEVAILPDSSTNGNTISYIYIITNEKYT
ncbi:MAG: hypothetical protein ACYDG6_06680 [Thermincolia bacterium]